MKDKGYIITMGSVGIITICLFILSLLNLTSGCLMSKDQLDRIVEDPIAIAISSCYMVELMCEDNYGKFCNEAVEICGDVNFGIDIGMEALKVLQKLERRISKEAIE